MTKGPKDDKRLIVLFFTSLIDALIADHNMLNALLQSMTLFATLIAGFGLGTGASLTYEDMKAYAEWRVSVGALHEGSALQGWTNTSTYTTAQLAAAVRGEQEWADHAMGSSTLNCTGTGLMCAVLCMAAYTIATEDNCEVLGNVKNTSSRAKTHEMRFRCALVLMKCLLVFFALSSFVSFCACVWYFGEVANRALTIKFFSCDRARLRWLENTGATSRYTSGDCGRRLWNSVFVVGAATLLPVALIIGACIRMVTKMMNIDVYEDKIEAQLSKLLLQLEKRNAASAPSQTTNDEL